jgi:16S rRNA (uracil1498-N3)-methyltransferase
VKRRKHGPPRFFVEGVHAVGDIVELSGADARKLLVVLRGRIGQALEICDSGGNTFVATLVADGEPAAARLEERHNEATEASREIVLYQSVPKGSKMDFVIEKATELGVARIVPVTTERTIAATGDVKVERWNRLARTAAAQCGRSRIPSVAAPVAWHDVFRVVQDAGDLILFPWELAERVALRDALPELLTQPGRVAVLIGPEGGISHEEAAVAVAAGAHPISLGPRIFRTETAGMVLISAVLYALGDV